MWRYVSEQSDYTHSIKCILDMLRMIKRTVCYYDIFIVCLAHCDGENGYNFAGNMFKSILLNENVGVSIKILLKCNYKGPIDNKSAFVQIIAWHTHICVTWHCWIIIEPKWHLIFFPAFQISKARYRPVKSDVAFVSYQLVLKWYFTEYILIHQNQ